MKLAYSNLACPEWPLSEVMSRAAEYGYQGVELRLVDGEVIRADLEASARKDIVRLARASGVTVIGVGASTRFAMPDPGERARQEAELIRYLELAADLEAPIVRTFGGENSLAADTAAQYVAESLERVASRAIELGVHVLLETHDAFSASSAVMRVMARVPSPAIGALWDTHHPYRMGESAEQSYAALAPRLRHVHIKDARRDGDRWQLVPLGDGEVPVRDVLALLRQNAYDGWITVEWERKWHPEIAPADVALPQHIAVLREWLQS